MRVYFVLVFASLFLIAGRPALCESNADSAKNFLETVYRSYGKNASGGVALSGSGAARVFHASLLALMRADEKANGPGNVGVLDGDPVCGCQDWDGIWDLKIAMEKVAATRATADVSFWLSPPGDRKTDDRRAMTVTLAMEHDQWRIYDIEDHSDVKAPFALRRELERDIRKLTKPAKDRLKQ